MFKLPALLALVPLTAGCFIIEPDPVPCSNLPGCVPPPEEVDDVMTITSNLDLLFVIDDSPSMVEKQTAFRAAFPSLVDKLSAIDGGMPNLHLAVISPDMGTSAVGDAQPGPGIGQLGQGGCQSTGKNGAFQLGQATLPDENDRFLSLRRDGSQNFEGDLETVFGQMSALGASGCGFEQPLAATQAALSGVSNPDNFGFLRPGANLAVIVLSDEDDCSAEHTSLFGPESAALGPILSFRCFRFGVECDQDTNTVGNKTNCRPATSEAQLANPDSFANALISTKGDGRRVLFGGVVGTGPVQVEMRAANGGSPAPAVAPACRFTPSGGGADITADPGIRLTSFANEFGGLSKLESICSEDLAPAASKLGDSIAAMMTETCLPAPRDESDCFVDDLRDGDAGFSDVLLPCSQAQGVGANCFSIVSDPSCTSGQRLSITRPIPPTGNESSTLRCRN